MLSTRRKYGNPKIEKEAGNELEFDANHELLWADLVKLGTSPGGKRPKALFNVLGGNSEQPEFSKGTVYDYKRERNRNQQDHLRHNAEGTE